MINLKSSKTVLIISFAYPPLAAIGARRVSKISKELLAIGWTPIIVTATAPKELFNSEIEIPEGFKTLTSTITLILKIKTTIRKLKELNT